MRYLLGSTAAFLCDYAAKEKVEKTYDEKKQKELFHGKVQIEKYHNRGGSTECPCKKTGTDEKTACRSLVYRSRISGMPEQAS